MHNNSNDDALFNEKKSVCTGKIDNVCMQLRILDIFRHKPFQLKPLSLSLALDEREMQMNIRIWKRNVAVVESESRKIITLSSIHACTCEPEPIASLSALVTVLTRAAFVSSLVCCSKLAWSSVRLQLVIKTRERDAQFKCLLSESH
jgi:acetolactate synthase regulatory subunit